MIARFFKLAPSTLSTVYKITCITSAFVVVSSAFFGRWVGSHDIGPVAQFGIVVGILGLCLNAPFISLSAARRLAKDGLWERHAFFCIASFGFAGIFIDHISAVSGGLSLFGLANWSILAAVIGIAGSIFPRPLQISLIISSLIFLTAEVAIRLATSNPAIPISTESTKVIVEGSYTRDYFMPDALTGYRIKPGKKVSAKKRQGSQTIYEVDYTINDGGWRETPESGPAVGPFVAFFGGSFVFGEGVSDSETLPSQFQKISPQRRAYNFGIHGWGPQHMLALLESSQSSLSLTAAQGDLVYLYIPGHMDRLTGAMTIHNAWGKGFPYYLLRDDHPKREGNMVTGRPWISKFFSILSFSKLAEWLGFDLYRLTPSDPKLLAAVFEQSCNLFSSVHGPSRCIIVFFPGGQADLQTVQEHVKLDNIELIDATIAFKDDIQKYLISGDGHPNVAGHRVLARLINSRVRDP